MLRLVVPLTFPVSFLSGIIFTLIAARAHQEIGGSLETTGLLTMANTIGAMIGSAMAGFVFIPALGMEKSLFVLSLSYCLVALFAMDWRPINRNAELVRGLVAALPLIGVVLLFPFGAMEKYKRSVGEKFLRQGPPVCSGPYAGGCQRNKSVLAEATSWQAPAHITVDQQLFHVRLPDEWKTVHEVLRVPSYSYPTCHKVGPSHMLRSRFHCQGPDRHPIPEIHRCCGHIARHPKQQFGDIPL